MNCPHCGHESFSLSLSEASVGLDTWAKASFICGGCRWQSPAGIASTPKEARKIADAILDRYSCLLNELLLVTSECDEKAKRNTRLKEAHQ